MQLRFLVAGVVGLIAVAAAAQPAAAQSDQPSIDLVVDAGRPLRVALDERIQLKSVGQPVTGTVIEPVYAYDRIVIDAGTKVRGHVSQIDSGSKIVRARAYLGGNFSPAKHAVLQFDTLVLDDGRELPIDTVVKGGIPNVVRNVAGGSKSTGKDRVATSDDNADPTFASLARGEIRRRANDAVSGARQAVSGTKRKVSDAFASIKSLRAPGRMNRLKDAAVQQLPYHPQYLARGTVYDAELLSPLSFGRAVPAEQAPVGTAPAPDSILTARLAMTLDSAKTPRGTRFEAVITETVFSADRQVILPEGTTLTGEVTRATPARRFHRNGQLRFLFESVQAPNQPAAPLLGALHSVDASADDRVAVDDEGGATLENSKTRFIAPALAILALHESVEHHHHHFADGDGGVAATSAVQSGGRASVLGGFFGFGLVGAAVSQITRPIGIAMGAYGAARTMYSNVLGKGREVTFPADTPIQVRLAPGPSK